MPTYPLLTAPSHPAHNLAGVEYHQDEIRYLVRTLGVADREEAMFAAELVPEPDNPYGDEGHAISVRFQNQVIGYLPQAKAHRYWQLCRITASGFTPTTPARIWGFWDAGRFRAWVHVALPEPDCLYPLNDPPLSEWALLPRAGSVQVTKEEDHLDVLSEYLPESGTGILLTTLHIIQGGIRKHWPLIEIRLDGERVGELTRNMSEYYVPTVRHFDDLGLATVALTRIQGSSISIQLTLLASRAHDLSEEDLTPPETPPLPTLVPFQADADRYTVPNSYNPTTDDEDISYGDDEQEEYGLENIAEANDATTEEVDLPSPDTTPPGQPLHHSQHDTPDAPARNPQEKTISSPKERLNHLSRQRPTSLSTAETSPMSTWLPTPPENPNPQATMTLPTHQPHENQPKTIRRIISIGCALFGLLTVLLAIFPPFYAPLVLVGIIFLIPSLWWLYCEGSDKQAIEEYREAAESRAYYSKILDPEEDATIIAGMGTATAQPNPMNRRWPLINTITVVIFVIALAITPTANKTTGPEETAPPTISVPSFTSEEKTTTSRTTSWETSTTRAEDPAEEEPALEEAGINDPEPAQEEPMYEEPVYEEPAYEEPASGGGSYYSSCADAKAAGAAPLFAGEDGYRSGLDLDGDGIACEK